MYPSFLLGVIFWKFSAATKWLQSDFFKLGNAGLGPTHVHLILAALLLYPFEVKEGPKQHVLSYVPFGRFCLATYPSEGTAASGASRPILNSFGLSSGFLGQLGLGSGLRDPLELELKPPWGVLGWIALVGPHASQNYRPPCRCSKFMALQPWRAPAATRGIHQPSSSVWRPSRVGLRGGPRKFKPCGRD